MYFPYLRGKQYELLALKEHARHLAQSGRIAPIIEPVRQLAGSGLDRCLAELAASGVPYGLVVNPGVGALSGESDGLLVDYLDTLKPPGKWWPVVRVSERGVDHSILSNLRRNAVSVPDPAFLIQSNADNYDDVVEYIASSSTSYTFLDSRLNKRRNRQLIANLGPVSLSDPFPAQSRNADYLSAGESIFTEEHQFYKEEGWVGFSDFLTVGAGYSEGGFTPRAVAIHWTFERVDDHVVMIRHFTSDNNGDTTNVGGKFLEAASKVIRYMDSIGQSTSALEVLRDYLESESYPGLGIVKKLSIQNHLELMNRLLSR